MSASILHHDSLVLFPVADLVASAPAQLAKLLGFLPP